MCAQSMILDRSCQKRHDSKSVTPSERLVWQYGADIINLKKQNADPMPARDVPSDAQQMPNLEKKSTIYTKSKLHDAESMSTALLKEAAYRNEATTA